jgi:hypothetical protein
MEKTNSAGQMSVTKILNDLHLSARPEAYSGRSEAFGDLNSKTLEDIYQGIVKYNGKEAGSSFVRMVSDIPRLSMTDFLMHLHSLEADGWKWDKKMKRNYNDTHLGDGSDLDTFAIGAITLAYKQNKASEVYPSNKVWIAGEFLKKHGVKSSELEKDVLGERL